MSQNINIKILATDKTAKAFSKVKKSFSSLAKAAAKVGKAAAAGFIAAAAGLAALTVSSMKSVDALAKTADKIGITSNALAGLQFAGEQTGVATETMNMALQRFTRRVSEAAQGTGEAKDALKEMNLDASLLLKLPLEDQMGAVADSMQSVGTQADRVRLAMKLFDSEGVALVNTLAQGSSGLDAMAKDADILGLAISRADAAKIEMANDSVGRLWKLFEGLGNQLAIAFSPIITAVANDTVAAATATENWGNIGERIVNSLVRGYAKIKGVIQNIGIALLKVNLKTIEWAISTQKVLLSMSQTRFSGVLKGIAAVTDFFSDNENVTDPFEPMREAMKSTEAELLRVQNALNEKLAEPPEENAILTYYADAVEAARLAGEAIASNQEEILMQGMTADKNRTEAQKKSAVDSAGIILSTTKSQMDGMSALFKEGSIAGKAFFLVQQGLAAATAVVQGFSSAMAIRAAYANMAIMAGPAAPAVLAAGEVHAQVATGMGFATAALIGAQTVASFEGGGFTGYGVRAGGVDGKGGMPAIIHPNETIIDHTLGQDQERGGGSTINFNIQATDASGFDQLLNSRRGDIMSMIEDVMGDQGRSFA